jgi:hypothetical protein
MENDSNFFVCRVAALEKMVSEAEQAKVIVDKYSIEKLQFKV